MNDDLTSRINKNYITRATDWKELGKALEVARVYSGKSIDDIGLRISTINTIENGNGDIPSRDLAIYCAILGIDYTILPAFARSSQVTQVTEHVPGTIQHPSSWHDRRKTKGVRREQAIASIQCTKNWSEFGAACADIIDSKAGFARLAHVEKQQVMGFIRGTRQPEDVLHSIITALKIPADLLPPFVANYLATSSEEKSRGEEDKRLRKEAHRLTLEMLLRSGDTPDGKSR